MESKKEQRDKVVYARLHHVAGVAGGECASV